MSGDRNIHYKICTLVNLRDRIKLAANVKKICSKNDPLLLRELVDTTGWNKDSSLDVIFAEFGRQLWNINGPRAI